MIIFLVGDAPFRGGKRSQGETFGGWIPELTELNFQGKPGVDCVLYTKTPPKFNMEPKNWWFVDVSPYPRGYFQVPC